MSQRYRQRGSSRYKGVAKHRDKWAAMLSLEGKTIWLGRFATEEEAAKRYDEEAVKHFGEEAMTNEKLGLYKDNRPYWVEDRGDYVVMFFRATDEHVLIDREDVDRITSSGISWRVRPDSGGVLRCIGYDPDTKRPVSMGRFVLGDPQGYIVHRDRNRLNCRRDNLMVADRMGLAISRSGKQPMKSTLYKGVYRNGEKVFASIRSEGKSRFLGYYDTEESAAEAYDRAAEDEFGEYATTNRDLGLL